MSQTDSLLDSQAAVWVGVLGTRVEDPCGGVVAKEVTRSGKGEKVLVDVEMEGKGLEALLGHVLVEEGGEVLAVEVEVKRVGKGLVMVVGTEEASSEVAEGWPFEVEVSCLCDGEDGC